jgi:hypothetical protein
MKKVIIISTLITVGVITAFGFVNRSTINNNSACAAQIKSDNIELSSIGINGGLIIDAKNGSVSQFLAATPDLFYSVQGRSIRTNTKQIFTQTITQEKLSKAQSINDLIENYPSSWIQSYRLVDIAVNVDGKITKEQSSNNELTKAQKEILNAVNIASDIVIAVHYDKKNYNDKIETRQMNVSMLVVPEVEAEYVGGYAQMITYLKENSIDKILDKKLDYLPQPSISFVVNEDGITENVVLNETSKDAEIDKLLIELIQKMPKWNPAKNAKGLNVKQEFVFNVGMDGC